MKKHLVIAAILALILFILPAVSYALNINSFKQTVGGRVIIGPAELASTIVCTAIYGPFEILSFRGSSGPFFINSFNISIPHVGGFVLGLASITPNMGVCTNPETGAPVPAYEVTPYGASRHIF